MISDIHRGIKFQSALPLRGATSSSVVPKAYRLLFQSALPLRGATTPKPNRLFFIKISIRAPLAGSDNPTTG